MNQFDLHCLAKPTESDNTQPENTMAIPTQSAPLNLCTRDIMNPVPPPPAQAPTQAPTAAPKQDAPSPIVIQPLNGGTRGKTRRQRFIFTSEQISGLKRQFEVDRYPDYVCRESLSRQLSVPENIIHQWFYNRRTRENKKTRGQKVDDKPASTARKSPRVSSPPQTKAADTQEQKPVLIQPLPRLTQPPPQLPHPHPVAVNIPDVKPFVNHLPPPPPPPQNWNRGIPPHHWGQSQITHGQSQMPSAPYQVPSVPYQMPYAQSQMTSAPYQMPTTQNFLSTGSCQYPYILPRMF